MGSKVLPSTKCLNITGDKKLVPRFEEPFSIVYLVGPLAYWLSLGTRYSKEHPIFQVSLFKPSSEVVMSIHIQQLCMSKMSKNGKSV